MAKKLDFKFITGGSRPTEVLSKGTYLLNIFLASQFIRKFQNYYLTSEPSGSRNPLGGFIALDVVPKTRTIFLPLVTWVTEARKCKAPVGNISSLQAHTVNIPYKLSIKRQNYYTGCYRRNGPNFGRESSLC